MILCSPPSPRKWGEKRVTREGVRRIYIYIQRNEDKEETRRSESITRNSEAVDGVVGGRGEGEWNPRDGNGRMRRNIPSKTFHSTRE